MIEMSRQLTIMLGNSMLAVAVVVCRDFMNTDYLMSLHHSLSLIFNYSNHSKLSLPSVCLSLSSEFASHSAVFFSHNQRTVLSAMTYRPSDFFKKGLWNFRYVEE